VSIINEAHIRIIGPDARGGFIVEFCKHTGMRLTFVVPPNQDNDVLAYFHERMPYGLSVPDVAVPISPAQHGSARKPI
jgi:hypothetical protein